MYRSDLNSRDKSGAIAGVVGIHILVALALLHLSGNDALTAPESVLRVFNLSTPPPPPPPPPRPQQQASKAKAKPGGSAPKNIRSEATEVVAPKPQIVVPPVPQIAATETPREGAAPTQGASDVRGPGTGSGGTGNGNGSGSGSGDGAGGDGGVVEPPRLTTPVLTGRDLPHDLLQQWPAGLPVFLRLRVNAQGYVSECNVLRGTGVTAIDTAMCNIAHDRLRFRPALNQRGEAVAGWFGYAQRPPR